MDKRFKDNQDRGQSSASAPSSEVERMPAPASEVERMPAPPQSEAARMPAPPQITLPPAISSTNTAPRE